MSVHDKSNWAAAKKALGIPADEPFFVLRAQDTFAAPILARYELMVRHVVGDKAPSPEWFAQLEEHQKEFAAWRQANESKVKVPD